MRTIPDFTDEGLLLPGAHEATLEELREKLGFSRRRRDLIDGLERALTLMGGCGVRRVYLDGSFVTDKPRPGDIDECYDVEPGMDLQSMYPIWPLTAVFMSVDPVAGSRSARTIPQRPPG